MKDHNSGVSVAEKFRKQTASANNAIRQAVIDVRQKIEDLQQQRSDFEKIAVEKDIAVQRAEDWLASIKARNMGQSFVPDPKYFSLGKGYTYRPTGELAALSFYLSPLLRRAVLDHIEDHYSTVEHMTEAERRKELESLDERILSLELTEEAILRSAEQAGFQIERRTDADPRAVLADESSLP